jgi:hypothetical protein
MTIVLMLLLCGALTVDGKKLESTLVEEGVISFPTENWEVYRVPPNK